MTTATLGLDHVQRWRRSWGDLMTRFLPGLGTLEATTAAAAEAVLDGPPAHVLDLGGGPGLLAERLLARWPRATVRVLDLDPVLLALAAAGAPPGVTVHQGDLAGSAWPAEVAPHGPVDLITIVMTMHYLPEERAAALYRDARSVLRPGGLLVVADLMPTDDLPAVMAALHPAEDQEWARWWDRIAGDPALASLMRQRREIFTGRAPAEFTPAEQWHRAAAAGAGFRESGVFWRQGAHAALGAIN